MGESCPEDDISQILREKYNITTASLDDDPECADQELRAHVKEYWSEVHDIRCKKRGLDADSSIVERLIRHDMESYLGVLYKRKNEERGDTGYKTWWLTIDTAAFKIEQSLKDRLVNYKQVSPIMSLDFLSNYVSLYPHKNLSSKENFISPIFLDKNFCEYIPKELIAIAEVIRKECANLPPHIVKRRIRDKLDEQKRRVGSLVSGGLRVLSDEFEENIEDVN
ncbi:MAG: hypothetical protein GC154_02045 [bacterium]|nr:hypothetical protein [bacterium]